jgi:sugar phosphate isomerase/epimerase
MRAALNAVTLARGLSPLKAAEVTAAAGFSSIGMWYDAVHAFEEKEGSLDKLLESPAMQSLLVEEICFLGGWMWATGEARETALQAAEDRAEMAAAIGSPLIIACASGGTGDPEQAAEDFRAICDIGAKYGVDMALEYIGAFEQYHDIKSGLELVRAADHPNAKLLIDVFHSFRGGTVVEDFKRPRGEEVGLVHINDVPAGDIMQMNDSHRVLPGEGVLPLREAIGYLGDAGYDGALSVEVFNQDLWALPLEEIAQRAKAGMDKLMS